MHWLHRHRLSILAVICAGWTAVVVSLHYAQGIPFLSAVWGGGEQNMEDLLQREGRKTATRPEFVFLGIDQTSLKLPPLLPEDLANNRGLQLMSERPFPWSREVWAVLLDRLFAAGARLVIFDIVFDAPNNGDAAFRAALDRYRDKVVIGANFDYSTNPNGSEPQLVTPNTTLIPPPAMEDDRVGYVNFWPDYDGIFRSARYTMTDLQAAHLAPNTNEQPYDSFGARALQKLGRSQDVPRDLKPHTFRFCESDAYPPRTLYEVFDSKFWHANYADGVFFKDKVVIVGMSAKIRHDFVNTPMDSEMPGPTLHLNAMAAALDHEFLFNTPLSTDFATACGAGLLSFGLIVFIRRPLYCLITLVAISAAYLGAARILFDRVGLLILVVPTLTVFVVSGLFGLAFEYTLERIEKLRTRRTLERYVSKNLVKEILDNPDSFYSSLRGVRISATILFSDIVGFTARTESADPETLVTQLNEYLSRMTATVFEHGGTLDKFIGDAVMAVWGNVRSLGRAEDAKLCARTALAMRRELRALNEKWHGEGTPPFAIGIGINHGDVLGGNIGSQEKADPTVIGDAVNLASRLESLTRTYGVDVLVGEKAGDLIRDEFHLRSVARVQVKGKTKPVEIFTLVGARNENGDTEFLKTLGGYEEAIQKFRARNFAEAKVLFAKFLESYPEDFLAAMYRERALEYEEHPPAEDWDGVEVFKKK